MYYDFSAQQVSGAVGLDGNELFLKATNFKDEPVFPQFAEPVISANDLNLLPAGSFFLSLKFTMATSYLSKDDEPWNSKNPIARDWVYKVPYVRPTTWKGRLRFAARQAGADRELIRYLFGNEKGEKSAFQEGRLHFYPTFFRAEVDGESVDGVNVEGEEVINPHERANRMGTVPVTLGAVKPAIPPMLAGSKTAVSTGKFAVLYLADGMNDSKTVAGSCCQWIADVLSVYGIGAKTLKGYGLARYSYKNVAFLPAMAGAKPLKKCTAKDLREKVEGVVPWNSMI